MGHFSFFSRLYSISAMRASISPSISLGKAAAKVFSGTALSRLSGLLRDISMAWSFGATPAVGALLLAFRLSHFFRRFLGEGAMNGAFVPEFERLRAINPNDANHFFWHLFIWITIGLGAFFSLLGLSVYAFSDLFPQTGSYMLALMPGGLFICLYGLCSARLTCDRIFFLPALAPAAFNIVWAAAAIFLSTAKEPMLPLAWAMTLGTLLQLFLVLFPILKTRVWPSFRVSLRPFLRTLGLSLMAIGATQINNVLDAVFARFADEAGPAYLWYALRVQQLPLALLSLSLTTALFPDIAALFQRDRDAFIRQLRFGFELSSQMMLFATVYFLCLGGDALKILFSYGAFSSSALDQSISCLYAYIVGLLAISASIVLNNACYAAGLFRVASRAAVLSVAVNIFLNALFVFGFGYGAISVALATSISAYVLCSLQLFSLRQELPSLIDWNRLIKNLIPLSMLLSLGAAGIHFFSTEALAERLSVNAPEFLQPLALRTLSLAFGSLFFVPAAIMIGLRGSRKSQEH